MGESGGERPGWWSAAAASLEEEPNFCCTTDMADEMMCDIPPSFSCVSSKGMGDGGSEEEKGGERRS